MTTALGSNLAGAFIGRLIRRIKGPRRRATRHTGSLDAIESSDAPARRRGITHFTLAR